MEEPRQQELSADIHLLGDLLGKVIRRLAGVDVFDLEERFRALSKVRRQDARNRSLKSLRESSSWLTA